MGEKPEAENAREVPTEAAPKTQTCANEVKVKTGNKNNTKPLKETSSNDQQQYDAPTLKRLNPELYKEFTK